MTFAHTGLICAACLISLVCTGASAEPKTYEVRLQEAIEMYERLGPPEPFDETMQAEFASYTAELVEIHAPEPEALSWEQFRLRVESSDEPLPHTLHYGGFVIDRERVDSEQLYRGHSAGASAWVDLAPPELTEHGSFTALRASYGYVKPASLEDRLAEAERLQRGPFDPRLAATLAELGEPDLVYEQYIDSHVLDDERWIQYYYRSIFERDNPNTLVSWALHNEGVLHPTWQDYQVAYTTRDGVETFRPIRHTSAHHASWIYLDEQLVVHIPPFGTPQFEVRPMDDETRAVLEDEQLNDPERYKRLQDALRPTSLLGDAVWALLEEEQRAMEAAEPEAVESEEGESQ